MGGDTRCVFEFTREYRQRSVQFRRIIGLRRPTSMQKTLFHWRWAKEKKAAELFVPLGQIIHV